MTSWYLLVPVHRPYSKHLRERIVFLYVVKGCSNIATELGGQPCKRTVERIVGAFLHHQEVCEPTGKEGTRS